MYQWDNNLKVADYLLKLAEKSSGDSGLKEGAIRAAIGRFYYACFKAADDIVKERIVAEKEDTKECSSNEDQDEKPKLYGSHENTIYNLTKCESSSYDKDKRNEIAEHLKELKGYRQQADYNQSTIFSPKRVSYIERLAIKTSNDLKTF